MSSPQSLPFKPSCPNGGQFYVKSTGYKFVGCCNVDPGNNGCSDGSLQPASFDPAFYNDLQDQTCPSGSSWYTCAATKPPFLGCCKSNPCLAGIGCPKEDIAAGWLSSNSQAAAVFVGKSATTDSSATSPSSMSSATRVPVSSSSSPTAAPVVTKSSSPGSRVYVIGGAVGGAVVVIILFALLAFYFRRRTQRSRQVASSGTIRWTQEKSPQDYAGHGDPWIPEAKPATIEKEMVFELHSKEMPSKSRFRIAFP